MNNNLVYAILWFLLYNKKVAIGSEKYKYKKHLMKLLAKELNK